MKVYFVLSPAVFLSVVPSTPTSFRIQQRHLDSIYVDWDLPAEPNGIITGYLLKYQTGTSSKPQEHSNHLAYCLEETATFNNVKQSCSFHCI